MGSVLWNPRGKMILRIKNASPCTNRFHVSKTLKDNYLQHLEGIPWNSYIWGVVFYHFLFNQPGFCLLFSDWLFHPLESMAKHHWWTCFASLDRKWTAHVFLSLIGPYWRMSIFSHMHIAAYIYNRHYMGAWWSANSVWLSFNSQLYNFTLCDILLLLFLQPSPDV